MNETYNTTPAALKSALAAIGPAIQSLRISSIPILSAFKIENGRAISTDFDMEISASLGMDKFPDTAKVIEYAQLARLVRLIPNDQSLALEFGETASLKFNGAEYGLMSYAAADFPDVLAVKGSAAQCGNWGLAAAMRKVAFAASDEETHYYLQGVSFFTNKDGVAHVVATDGHRLAMHKLPVMPEFAAGSIVPRRTVGYIASRKVEPNTFLVQEDRLRCQFEFDGLTVKSKMIDGTFPDVARVIPVDPTKRAVFDRASLLTSLRRAGAFMDGKRGRPVNLAFDSGTVTLSGTSDQMMKFSETIAVETVGENGFSIGFNCHYIIDILKSFDTETVEFHAADSSSPSLWTAPSSDFSAALMPRRV